LDRDWIKIILLGMAFGSALYFNEIMLRDMGPFYVALGRVGPAALACWVYVILSGRDWRAGVGQLGALAVLGGMFFWLPMTIYPIGQQYIESGLAGIVNAMTPVVTVIVSHFWPGGERASRLKFLGVLAGFLGIFLLTIPSLSGGEGNRLFGMLIVLLAPLGYAFGFNWVRRIKGLDTVVTITWAFTFAAIFVLLTALMFDELPTMVRLSTWAAIAFSGVILTGLLFQIAFSMLPRTGATKASTLTFIAPITALILGSWLLDERLQIVHFVGMAVIFLGLFLIDGRLFKRRDPESSR
jgi:drug/metabolite transporter (DMT)-like permease